MIAASRCPACGRVATPPEDRCRACRAETEPHELAPEGTVLTYAPVDDGWAGLVELAEGARTWLVFEEQPAIGDRVEVSSGQRPEA